MITLKEYSAGFFYIAVVPRRGQTGYQVSTFSNVNYFSRSLLVLLQIKCPRLQVLFVL